MFAGIVVAQVGNVLACRTSKQSILKTSSQNKQVDTLWHNSSIIYLVRANLRSINAENLRNSCLGLDRLGVFAFLL